MWAGPPMTSVQGRYHHYRLHPFSHNEALGRLAVGDLTPGHELPVRRGETDTVEALLQFGGFPEPFLAQSVRTHRRWARERLDRFFREDVRDLEAVRDLSSLELLADLLSARVASPLSLNALREDLDVSHRAVSHWIDVLERLYFVARIPPYVSPRVRALRKRSKAYLWDWSTVVAPGPRFENLVALHLLKMCHVLQDRDGFDVNLTYVRDRTGHELDFLVTFNRKPWFAVEAKVGDTRIDPAILYFKDRLRIPFVYQAVLGGTRDFVERGVRCLPAADLLAALV